MQEGVPLGQGAPGMHPESKVYVLGLSPNAGRLSVRLRVEESLGDFTPHFQEHWTDLKLEPPSHPGPRAHRRRRRAARPA